MFTLPKVGHNSTYIYMIYIYTYRKDSYLQPESFRNHGPQEDHQGPKKKEIIWKIGIPFQARLTAIPLQSCPVSFGLLESTRPQASRWDQGGSCRWPLKTECSFFFGGVERMF